MARSRGLAPSAGKRLGIIVVAYDAAEGVRGVIECLSPQKQSGDLFVVVDNHYLHETAQLCNGLSAVDIVIRTKNRGFAAACNLGVDALHEQADLIVLLNPDSVPAPNLLEMLRGGEGSPYAAYMGLVILPDGTVNTAGNVIHVSGLSWCGDYARPADACNKAGPVTALSGACMVVRRSVWVELGGLCDDYFLYYEDTDFSSRAVLRGMRLGIVPSARIVHDYHFIKGSTKWLYLERNRYLYILRTWPGPVIAALLPELIMFELGLWLVSLRERRFRLKVQATLMAIRKVPWALKTRREVQSTRTVPSHAFLASLHPVLDSRQLVFPPATKYVNLLAAANYLVALSILRAAAVFSRS